MPIEHAANLADIKKALGPGPLTLNELPGFFLETSEARDPMLARREKILEFLDMPENSKVLVTGHAGAGKSTELVKLQEEHRDRYAFVSFSLIKEAQLSQASIEVLLVLIVETLVRDVREELGVSLSEKTLEAIYQWFSEAFHIKEEDLKYAGEIGVSADTGRTFWGKLLGVSAFLKADIKTGANTLHRTITKENRRLSELAYQCNLLIREARIAVKEAGQRELVLIIEDLDKVPIQAADEIFIQNPAPLADLDCKVLFTAPIWLLCNPRSQCLDAMFKKITIPMIKPANQDGTPCREGRDALVGMLRKRMDVDHLIEKDALTLAIEKTGGVLRHLFDVLVTAASTASQAVKQKRREGKKIALVDVRYGLDQLKSDLVRRLGVIGLPKEYLTPDVSVEAMYSRLRQIAKNPRKLESDSINLLLLQSHAVIEYNGAGWHRVHPLIAEYIESAP